MPRIGKDDDLATRVLSFLKSKIDRSDLEQVAKMLLGEGAEDAPGSDPLEHSQPAAMDGLSLAMDSKPHTAEGQRALRLATELCEPIVGRHVCLAADSAADLMRKTLLTMGVASGHTLPAAALPDVLQVHLRNRRTAAMANDSNHFALQHSMAGSTNSGFLRQFPAAGRIKAA